MTRKIVLGMLAAVLLGGAGAWYAWSHPDEARGLRDLGRGSLAQLQSEFNAAAGNMRLLVLLSPT